MQTRDLTQLPSECRLARGLRAEDQDALHFHSLRHGDSQWEAKTRPSERQYKLQETRQPGADEARPI